MSLSSGSKLRQDSPVQAASAADLGGGGGAVGASELVDLTDVDSAAQADGHVLASGGGNFREEDISSLTEGHVSLSDLKDVGTTSTTDGHVIAADGSDFDSEAITTLTENHVSLSDLSDIGSTSATDGHVIASDGTDFDSEAITSVTAAHVGIRDLSDVSLSTLGSGAFLQYDGSNWVNVQSIDADTLDGQDGTHYESTVEISDGTNVETLSEYKSGESFPSRLRVQSGDGSVAITVDPSADPATLDLTQSGNAAHSLDDHTSTSILGDPSGVDAGHLLFTDGTNWVSQTGPTSPTDAQVAIWDETDQKYRFVSFGTGLSADPDTEVKVASGGITDTELDETITYDIDITGSAGDADTLDSNQGSHYETIWELKAAGGTTATVSEYRTGTNPERVRVESSDSNIGISVTEGDPNVLDLTLSSSALMSFTIADDQSGNNPNTTTISDGNTIEFIGDGNVTTTVDPSASNPEVELAIASNSIGTGEVTSDIAILSQNATWTGGGIEVQGKQAASTLPDSDNNYAYIADDQTGAFHATGGGLVAPYKIHIQDGHGRVNHLWNVDEASGTYQYETGSEAAQNLRFGVDIFELRMGPASSATAGNAISWNTALHVNDSGQVGLNGATSLSSGVEIAGNVDMRSNNITNVGNVDGVDISAHASRHQHTGSDTVNAVPLGDPNGTNGQFLQSTGGNGTQWADALNESEADDLYLKRVDSNFTDGSYTPSWDKKMRVQDESGDFGIIYAEEVTE